MYQILFYCSFLILISSCHSSNASQTEPIINEVSEDNFNPDDHDQVFRRTTLIVRDINKSLALYRDAIGMEIIYDNILERPHPSGEGTQQVKLVFLKSVHHFYGVLGLLEYQYGEQDKEIKPVQKEGFTAGNTVLLFNTNDQDAGYAEITKLQDIEIFTEPKIIEYPSYDGQDPIRVKVCVFYDPDGFLVEYNEVIEGL